MSLILKTAVLVVGISHGQSLASGAQQAAQYPDPTDPADTTVVESGNVFRLVIEANPTTGYAWEVSSLPEDLLEQTEDPVYVSDPETAGMMGAGGRQVWSFRALSEGDGEIVFGLFPPDGDEPEVTRSYFVSVT